MNITIGDIVAKLMNLTVGDIVAGMRKRWQLKLAFAMFTAAVLIFTGVASTGGTATPQNDAQAATVDAGKKLQVGHDYPISQMQYPTAEQSNDQERLLRMNDPNKIGYVYLTTANGQILMYYTIKGKVSSTASQILNTQDVSNCENGGSGSYGYSCAVVDSVGDDGTYGPEECGSVGIFFFTTAGGLVETCDPYWFYSDFPVHMTQPPLIVTDSNATPTSRAGIVGGSKIPSTP